MATPTFNLNLSVISACDADDWDGGVGILDTVIFKQNNASLSLAVRDGGTAGYTHPTTSWDMSGTDTHIRMWVIHTFVTNLELKANGGIQLYVKDTSNNYNYYYVSGSDTHPGSWELVQADLASPDVDGSANLAVIEEFGWEIVHATAARNIVNTWWDYCVFGTGYEVKGGTGGDKVTWATLAAADLALGYGVVTLDRGVFFVNSGVDLGDTIGTGDLYFDGTNAIVVYYAANESAGLYKITGVGNGTGTTDIDMSGTVFKSDSNRFAFDMSAANVDAFVMDGSKLDYAGVSTFKSGQTITNTVFNDCSQVDPGLATFKYNAIKNYTDDGPSSGATEAALLWPTNDSNCSDNEFSDCTVSVEYDTNSDATPVFHNMIFDDNSGWYDVLNTSGNSATDIELTGTSNANSYIGDYTTFDSSYPLTMYVQDEAKVPILDAQCSIHLLESPYTELLNEDSATDGFALDTYSGSTPIDIVWKVRKSETTDDPRYFARSDTGQITTDGFNITVTLKVNPYI